MDKVLSAWAWVALVVLVLLGCVWMAIVFAVTAPWDPARYTVGRWFRRVGVACVTANPLWKFSTGGVRIRDPRRPYVAISNHESWADVFLISHLPWEMKWLTKDNLFRIPVVGWMLRMAGDIPVRRGDRGSALEALAACRDRLDKRVSVMIFPEGTRSVGSELLPFKDGAFRLAIETGCPILPIAVAGTRHAMAKGSYQFRRARAHAVVLEPIETAGLTLADLPALRERSRTLIAEARRGIQEQLGLTPAGDRAESVAVER